MPVGPVRQAGILLCLMISHYSTKKPAAKSLRNGLAKFLKKEGLRKTSSPRLLSEAAGCR